MDIEQKLAKIRSLKNVIINPDIAETTEPGEQSPVIENHSSDFVAEYDKSDFIDFKKETGLLSLSNVLDEDALVFGSINSIVESDKNNNLFIVDKLKHSYSISDNRIIFNADKNPGIDFYEVDNFYNEVYQEHILSTTTFGNYLEGSDKFIVLSLICSILNSRKIFPSDDQFKLYELAVIRIKEDFRSKYSVFGQHYSLEKNQLLRKLKMYEIAYRKAYESGKTLNKTPESV